MRTLKGGRLRNQWEDRQLKLGLIDSTYKLQLELVTAQVVTTLTTVYRHLYTPRTSNLLQAQLS
jgi:hypothetical protein